MCKNFDHDLLRRRVFVLGRDDDPGTIRAVYYEPPARIGLQDCRGIYVVVEMDKGYYLHANIEDCKVSNDSKVQ
jgi:hypothetical protein